MTWTLQQTNDLSQQWAVVTGANSGLGFHTASQLASKDANIIMACRSKEKGEQAIQKIKKAQPTAKLHLVSLDLASLDSVSQCVQHIKSEFPKINYLVNNAGVMIPKTFSKTIDGFELQFGTNHLGHFSLTAQLFDHFAQQSGDRIVSLGSVAHQIGWINLGNLNAEKRYDKYTAYGRSKLACIMFAYEAQRRLSEKNSRVQSLCAHPGWSSTNLQRHSSLFRNLNPIFSQSAKSGAHPILRALLDPHAQGGEYYGPSGFMELKGKPKKTRSNKRSYDTARAKALWKQSEQLTKVSFL